MLILDSEAVNSLGLSGRETPEIPTPLGLHAFGESLPTMSRGCCVTNGTGTTNGKAQVTGKPLLRLVYEISF